MLFWKQDMQAKSENWIRGSDETVQIHRIIIYMILNDKKVANMLRYGQFLLCMLCFLHELFPLISAFLCL